ncbi:rhodanese-like domain-containing protein [Spirillospora sp. CA-253888]
MVLASAAGRRAFPHRALTDGDEVDLGGLTLRALATPGHTDEHLPFLLLDGESELGVFTKGLADRGLRGAHRPARPGPRRGPGPCPVPLAAALGHAAAPDRGVADPRGGLVLLGPARCRAHHHHRRPEARQPAAQRTRRGPALDAAQVKALLADGGQVVDVRPAAEFAAGHIPGALSISLRDQFATWLGRLLPDTVPLVFVTGPGQDPEEIVWPAYKIGYELLAGHLDSRMPAWLAAGRPQVTTAFVTADRAPSRPYVDVRQQAEYTAGHVLGALNLELGSLTDRAADAPAGAVVACGRGDRAMTAASVLERAGHTDITVLDGGPAEYAKAQGQQLTKEPGGDAS